jgi:ATPase complex subunit ATP10
MGYFWYLKDLTATESKPVVANDELIPTDIAQIFPPLNGHRKGSLKTLNGKEESLPHYFISGNRSSDPSAYCTLVGIAFTDYGNKMLPSWMDPFEHIFRADKSRVRTAWLSINEGTTLYLLKYFITNSSLRQVPEERRDRTFLFFGNCPEFRDVLRMHNNKTAYVFLLDGLGRVRFAGSGKATDQDLQKLFRFTKELAPGLKAEKGEERLSHPKRSSAK